MLESVTRLTDELHEKYRDRLAVNPDLKRSLVSFQASKKAVGYRWFKYKEGYSPDLVKYVLERTGVTGGRVLDPFAGSGTTLFAANEMGLASTGIELLPLGCEIIGARHMAVGEHRDAVVAGLEQALADRPWEYGGEGPPFPHLGITRGAFSVETEGLLARYLGYASQQPAPLCRMLRFAAMCVLEAISYTRKDGQYLRWDQRADRKLKSNFDKGVVHPFDVAVAEKLGQIVSDIRQAERPPVDDLQVVDGSCLEQLARLPANEYAALVTSPPYCNRYDYTRTYALELAFLGVGEDALKRLRQTMLTCTVENREKSDLLASLAPDIASAAVRAFDSQELLKAILIYLEECKSDGTLNNSGIPRMVKNYFWETTVTLALARPLLRSGSPVIIVNDNVRYQGVDVPADLITCDLANALGYSVEVVWVLPTGKGNSSQQMGRTGRSELRKCVYVFRR